MGVRIIRHSKRGVAHYTVEVKANWWNRWKLNKTGTFSECLDYLNSLGAMEGDKDYIIVEAWVKK